MTTPPGQRLAAEEVAASDLRLAGPAGAAWLTAAFVLGSGPQAALVVTGVLVAAGLLTLRARRRLAGALAAALLCAAAAGAVCGVRLAALRSGPVPRLAAAGAPVTAELVVTGDPELHAARVRGSALGRSLVVLPARISLVRVRGAGVRLRTPVTVLATGPGWTGLLPSQRLTVTGRLAQARRGDLVAAVLLARGPPGVLSNPSPVQGVAGRIRAGLRSASAAAGGHRRTPARARHRRHLAAFPLPPTGLPDHRHDPSGSRVGGQRRISMYDRLHANGPTSSHLCQGEQRPSGEWPVRR